MHGLGPGRARPQSIAFGERGLPFGLCSSVYDWTSRPAWAWLNNAARASFAANDLSYRAQQPNGHVGAEAALVGGAQPTAVR